MIRLRNTATDTIVFISYHIFVIVVSIVFFIIFTTNLGVIEFFLVKNNSTEIADTAITNVRQVVSVEKINGTVLLSGPNIVTHQLVADEDIHEGSLIETKNKSAVLLSFGGKYTCKIRLGANTIVNVDELMKPSSEMKQEFSIMRLIKGAVIVHLKSHNNPVRIGIKTKIASFGVRGTMFYVETDESNYSFLGVKEGTVESESFISLAKNLISGGKSFFTNKSSGDKLLSSPAIIDRINWDYENIRSDLLYALQTEKTKQQLDTIVSFFPFMNTTSQARLHNLRRLVDNDEVEEFISLNKQLYKNLEEKKKKYDEAKTKSDAHPEDNNLMTEVSSLKSEIELLESSIQRREQVIEEALRQIKTHDQRSK